MVEPEGTEIEQLDLCARALTTEGTLPRLAAVWVPLSVILIFVAFCSNAPFSESIIVRCIAVATVFAAIGLMAKWRYSLYPCAVVFLALAIGSPFFDEHSRSVLGRSTTLAYCCMFINWGWIFWKRGGPFAATRDEKWRSKRAQVKGWITDLEREQAPDRVLEIQAGSFWTGYFTYRFLNRGDSWAIARFTKGNLRRLIEYRVRSLSAVQLTESDKGRKLEIDGLAIGRIE